MRDAREIVAGMEVLVAVSDAQSFSAAAKRLGLTSSAVSKLVTRLEQRLKVRLVQRTTRKMALTDVGLRYCERARTVLEAIEGAEREVDGHEDAPRGTLRVTAPTVLGQVRVVPVVIAFERANPDVRVELELSDRFVDVLDERFDVAVRVTVEPPPGLVARRLDDDRRVLCASPRYVVRRSEPKTPRDLGAHDCILFGRGRPADTWRLFAVPGGPEVAPVKVSWRLFMNNTLAIRDAALAGAGIADLPRYVIDADLASGTLLPVLPEYTPSERGVFAVYAPHRFLPAKVRHFVKDLRRAMRGAP